MGTNAAMQTFFNNSDTKPNPGGFEGFLNSPIPGYLTKPFKVKPCADSLLLM